MKQELDAIQIINRLMPTLTYLELTVLENAISTRRYKMRETESKKFKEIEEVGKFCCLCEEEKEIYESGMCGECFKNRCGNE